MNSKLIMGCLASLGVAFGAASVYAQVDRDAMAERLRPVGQLCLQGEDCGTQAMAAAEPQAGGGGNGIDGEGIYNRVCMACHETGAAGAPVRGNEDNWADRIDQGIETLYEHAITGIGAMPPRGGNPNLSDEEVMAAANHLLDPVMDDLPEIGGGDEGATASEEGAADDEATDVAATDQEATEASATEAGTDEAAVEGIPETSGEQSLADAARELDGEALYSTSGCAACHGTGAAGAPIVGDADAWAERLDKGMETLYEHAITGFGAMPPKGGNVSLADEEVAAVVNYMAEAAE